MHHKDIIISRSLRGSLHVDYLTVILIIIIILVNISYCWTLERKKIEFQRLLNFFHTVNMDYYLWFIFYIFDTKQNSIPHCPFNHEVKYATPLSIPVNSSHAVYITLLYTRDGEEKKASHSSLTAILPLPLSISLHCHHLLPSFLPLLSSKNHFLDVKKKKNERRLLPI